MSHLTDEYVERYMSPLLADHSAEYAQEQRLEKEAAIAFSNQLKAAQDKRQISALGLAAKTQQISGDKDMAIPFRPSETKSKVKTRPTETVTPAATLAQAETPDAPTPPPQIPVLRESLLLFAHMLPTPSSSDVAATATATKEVRWPQLVKAMADAGFSATQSAGSAVTFEKDNTASIFFHRPHPDPKISPTILRVMGKRLRRRFGWGVETFVEREKGAASDCGRVGKSFH